jgi:PAS domain-containing protein
MTEHTVQGVVVTDSERILYANPAVRNLYGVPLGRVLMPLCRAAGRAVLRAALQRYHQMLQNGQQAWPTGKGGARWRADVSWNCV